MKKQREGCLSFRKHSIAWTLACWILVSTVGPASAGGTDFDEDRAYAQLTAYMNLSPLPPGSAASETFAAYVKSQLEPLGFTVEFDEWRSAEAPVPMRNLIATSGAGPRIHLIGAHYDTRLWADKDSNPKRRRDPVPGANDGGSGVAVLLELARAVQVPSGSTLKLAFFDAEDQGGVEGYANWILGSTRMASRLTPEERSRIAEVIVVDIVGDPALRLVREGNSDPAVAARVWELARGLGYGDTFVEGEGAGILDDHMPFRNVGLPVLDLVQLEGQDGSPFFAWHHTTQDTIEHVSRASLGRVGRVLESYIESPPVEASGTGLYLRRGVIWPMTALVVVLLGAALALRARFRRQRRKIVAHRSPRHRRGKHR